MIFFECASTLVDGEMLQVKQPLASSQDSMHNHKYSVSGKNENPTLLVSASGPLKTDSLEIAWSSRSFVYRDEANPSSSSAG